MLPNLPRDNGFTGTGRKPRDWQLGGIAGDDFPVIRLNGDWRSFVPEGEQQGISQGCVSHSMCNVLEIHAKGSGLGEFNFSDRALAKASNTQPTGNNFWTVWMAAKNYGLVPEELWPAAPGMDWDEYYADLPEEVDEAAAEFVKKYTIQLRWIEHDRESMEYALMCGPLWVASQRHAYTLVARGDGGWIAYDSFLGLNGNFMGFHPDSREFSGVAQVRLVPKTDNMPPVLPEECLVFEAENSGRWGLHVKGRLFVDDLPKLEGQWMLRNRDSITDMFTGGPMKPLTTQMFNSFPHYNLKGEKVN